MYPIDRLNFLTPSQAVMGSLLLQRVGGPANVSLRTVIDDGGDGLPALLYFSGASHPFLLQPAPATTSLWIGVDDWQVEVDPASSYSAAKKSPSTGDAFVWNGTRGFVSDYSYDQRFISREGAVLNEEELGWSSFTGFHRWRIVHWPDRGIEPTVLFERQDLADV